jgi:Tfp pilus assembly protein PilX
MMNKSTPQSLQQGIVLPTVLIMIVILTSLVITQVRRSTVDQQLAVNSREYAFAEAAVQTVLRRCEAELLEVGDAAASAAGNPAWRDPAEWVNKTLVIDSDVPNRVVFPAVNDYGCLLENATAEMPPASSPDSFSAEARDDGMRKYRITARVVLRTGQQIHLQSEMRFDRNSFN